jgi:hypothetical protein
MSINLLGGESGGSSSTQAPVTEGQGGAVGSGGVETSSGNIAETSQSYNTNGAFTQTNLTTGLPVSDVEHLLDTTFGSFGSAVSSAAGSISNEGIAQTQANQTTSVANSQNTVLYVGIAAAVLLAAFLILRR